MNVKTVTPCEYARQRHQTLLRWRNFWNILVFSFGTAIIAFYIIAVFLFSNKLWLPAALATVGFIVTGVGVQWVVKRRKESVKEEEEAYKDVEKYYDN